MRQTQSTVESYDHEKSPEKEVLQQTVKLFNVFLYWIYLSNFPVLDIFAKLDELDKFIKPKVHDFEA